MEMHSRNYMNYFFLAFSLLHIPRVDIYRYTEYFLSYPDNNEEPKKRTTQKNVPRNKASDDNISKFSLQTDSKFVGLCN